MNDRAESRFNFAIARDRNATSKPTSSFSGLLNMTRELIDVFEVEAQAGRAASPPLENNDAPPPKIFKAYGATADVFASAPPTHSSAIGCF